MGLSDCVPLWPRCSPHNPKEEELARTVIDLIAENDYIRQNMGTLFSKQMLDLCKLYVDKVRPRIKTRFGQKNLTTSDSIIFFFGKTRCTEDPEDYKRLSQSLNSLVLKSSKKTVSPKDLFLFFDEFNPLKVEGAMEFLLDIKKKIYRGADELTPLFNEAAQNIHLYSVSRNKKSNCCEKLELADDRASPHALEIPACQDLARIGDDTIAVFSKFLNLPGTSTQHALDALKRYSASFVAPRQIKFPLDSILAVVKEDRSLNVKAVQKTLLDQANVTEQIEHAKQVLQKIGRNLERRAKIPLTKKYILGWFSKVVEGPVNWLYVKAVEELNLYCLTNGINLDVNKSLNIDAPTKHDISSFLDNHPVGLKNENLIRAFLSTAGYPNSNSHAIAAAMHQTPKNFAENLAGDPDENDLIDLISAYVIRNQVFADINPAFEANTQRIKEFLDTNWLRIACMGEVGLLNHLALVGSYKDECIVHASRLRSPNSSPIQPPIECRGPDKRKLYYEGVYNLFVAWREINKGPSSERPEEQIFCADFIWKLIEQSAGKRSEALLKGIKNFCAVHEIDADSHFLQSFSRENNHLINFLDSNWDKIQPNIDIYNSLTALETVGKPGTIDNDIVNIINSGELRGSRECHFYYEAVNLSRELLVVAAATNQIDELKLLKDLDGLKYLRMFKSILCKILNSEESTDLALLKPERISSSILELKIYWFVSSLKLPAFSVLESFLKTEGSKIAGQPHPLQFLGSFWERKNEKLDVKIKRLSLIPQNPENIYAPGGRFDYLLATYRLIESMIEAKLPLSMFKDVNFPDLRILDKQEILEYDELIHRDEVSKADKILGLIYRIVKNDDGTLPEHFVEAAEAVNLLSLSRCGSAINWRGLEITDQIVEDFKRGANIPEKIAEDDEIVREFLVTYGLSKSGSKNKPPIVEAMNLRQQCSHYKDRLMKENDGSNFSVGSTENISQSRTQQDF